MNLYFSLDLDYDRTSYNPLKYLSKKEYYDYDKKKYVWIFSVKDFDKVKTILGTKCSVDCEDEIKKLIANCKPIKKEIYTDKYKGYGFVDVIEYPKIFVVKTVIRKKDTQFKIPKQTVEKLWEVIKKYPLDKPIKTRTVAEHYCNAMNITRFHRDVSHTWDFEKFSGSRGSYFQFYYSLKVLQHYKVIKHYKDGRIAKLKDEFLLQTVFKEG